MPSNLSDIPYSGSVRMQEGVHSFVVRIWSETANEHDEASAWRGTVEEVLSGESLHFQDFDGLLDFIRQSIQSSTHDIQTR